MQFGIHLVRTGALSAEDFVAVIERQLRERPPLGMLAIEQRKLTMKQLFTILEAQAAKPAPFGRVAVELGYLSPSEVLQLVGLQSERCQAVAELIVELGLLDAATVESEMQKFHAASHHRLAVHDAPSPNDAQALTLAGESSR